MGHACWMLVFLSGLVQQRGLLQGSVCVGVPNPPHPTDPVCVCVSLACAATVAGPSCCVTAAQCKLQPLRHEESPFNTFCDVLTRAAVAPGEALTKGGCRGGDGGGGLRGVGGGQCTGTLTCTWTSQGLHGHRHPATVTVPPA